MFIDFNVFLDCNLVINDVVIVVILMLINDWCCSGTVARVPYWEADMIGYDSGRRLRTSAIFTRSEPYAVFGQTMAYERPLYFHTDSLSLIDDEVDRAWTLPKPTSIHGIKSCKYCIIYTARHGLENHKFKKLS